MNDFSTDFEADILSDDRSESPGLMEPLLLSEGAAQHVQAVDLALELAQKSAGLKRGLPEGVAAPLADLVRAMNCYYSNLIEGHDTHPVEIERALREDYSTDARTRDLQQEARAHIAVQAWIDAGGLGARALTADAVREIHRRFCAELPAALLWAEDPHTGKRVAVEPGAWRRRDVVVGRHVAVSPGAVPRFMQRFDQAYGAQGRTARIVNAAAAHHRLLWIHPFMDGNGRVARLMSHAALLEVLDTGALWSVARGLARNVQDYKQHLAACDEPRRGDLDGRGTLSEKALGDFTLFFLRVCIDQAEFMESLMQPDTLHTRIRLWAEEMTRLGKMPAKAGAILDAVLYRGALPREALPGVTDTGERQARRIAAQLVELGVLTAQSSRAPLHIAFPAHLAHRFMPGLFPDKPEDPESTSA